MALSGGPNEGKVGGSAVNTAADNRVQSSSQRLFQLIDARRKRDTEIMERQDQMARDYYADYQEARAQGLKDKEAKERALANARRDWHDDAVQWANMGMQTAGPWGALVGLIGGTIKGQAEAIDTKMKEDDMDFWQAYGSTHFDLIPGYNIGAGAMGMDGREQSYMYKNVLEGDEQAAMDLMGNFSGLMGGLVNAGVQKAGQRPLQQNPQPQYTPGGTGYQANTSLSAGGAPNMPTFGSATDLPNYQTQGAQTTSLTSGLNNYNLQEPGDFQYGKKKPLKFEY